MKTRRLARCLIAGCVPAPVAVADVVIEHREIRLVLGDDAQVLRLANLPPQTGCRAPGVLAPAFSRSQHRGYGGTSGPRILAAHSVRPGDHSRHGGANAAGHPRIRLRRGDPPLMPRECLPLRTFANF